MCTRVLTSYLLSRREGSLSSSSASSTSGASSISADSSSEHSSSEHSQASTYLFFGQVPFEEFLPRIIELCRSLWPNACHDLTEVGRMRGGEGNRIFELSIVHCQGAEKTKYILRVPRYIDEDELGKVDFDVAYLKYVKENSNIPVPEVVTFDGTIDNPLQWQYMVQRLVPGEPLESVYDSLDQEDKCNIARELGGICFQMLKMKGTVPGLFVRGQDGAVLSSSSKVEPWPYFCELDPYELDSTPKREDSLLGRSCFEMLIWIFERRLQRAGVVNLNYMINEMEECIKITKEMEPLGYLDDCQISLWHGDMMPTNIMIDSTTRPTISAVLNWDNASFVHTFMSCCPPLFLWDSNSNPLKNTEIPATAELRELKRIFDEAAGPDYVRYAYEPQYRILRNLFGYTLDPWGNDYYPDEIIEDNVAEWAEINQKSKSGFRSRMKKRLADTANLYPRHLPFLLRHRSQQPSDSQ